MSETLQFNFHETKMCLDVPQNIFDETLSKGEYFSRIVGFHAQRRVVDTTNIDGGVRLSLNMKRAGSSADRRVKHDRCRQLITAVEEVAAITPKDQQDPNLSVEIGIEPIGGSNRYGFNAVVKRPVASPSIVQNAATTAMRQTAEELRYMPKSILSNSVYAHMTESYVSLETNPVGSCSLDTDGVEYEPDSSDINLYAHNLYNHEMQLICLSGLIAIARS